MILALDQALVTTGWSILNDDNQLVDCGCFTINGKDSIEKRLGILFHNINEIYNKYHFNHLVLEDIQQQQNPNTYKKLAYVQATIFLWCYFNNMEYTILSPSQWRKICGGNFGKKREEQKQKAIDLVKQIYNRTVDSDTADAICIGNAYCNSKKESKLGFGVI